ncbi:MarR family transcriptional regulator [Labilibaculum sp.]|uniref:MarR family winged helix-turn-helix transcriptional regulator n=1 Tax=Labilibaculum sp. TaxID=2060723 RepID=UPI002AA825F8|nr:MarR family transcriptional regulator [Labilibaculum sp.]MBN2598200.1 MarR family transcriptional regulator [Marinifilaceae bacterium]
MDNLANKEFNPLKLENQLCFTIYAASRLMTRQYQPYLDQLGITYPQYLVFLVLWEKDGIGVNEIGCKLYLNTNTLTPLLKRMEQLSFIKRIKCCQDERKVLIYLSDKGKDLKNEAINIPLEMAKSLNCSVGKAMCLKNELEILINQMLK